jgi:hypothetical protein
VAYFLVRNSLNPAKAVTFGITYKQVVDKSTQDGELKWVIEIATDEPHAVTSGTIPSYFINTTNLGDLDDEIEKGIAYLSSQIDWQPLVNDNVSPYVIASEPTEYEVGIGQNVMVNIVDLQPSTGINRGSINMTINGIDVTNDLEIFGDEFDYEIRWRPPSRIYEQFVE